MVAYVAISHPWADRDIISIRAFQDIFIVMREPGSMPRQLPEEAFVRHCVKPGEVFEVDGEEAARASVAADVIASIISIGELGEDP
jgi:LysR family transcriptional regulator, low CO2-responsive transcriptional regulator